MESPGEWICEEDDRPTTTAYSIRRGIPAVFNPPGSFDAIVRKDGLYVRYLGVPVVPWVYWEDERDFLSIERTFDPERFPEETSDDFRELAERLTPAKVVKRERRARE